MLFNSGLFLFGFFPAFLLAYFSTPARWRNLMLFGGSLLFYAWAEPVFVFWALGSALLDYALGLGIIASKSAAIRRLYVSTGIVANLALLAWFKYAYFASDVLTSVLAHSGAKAVSLPAIALPIAISFIVFEKITYLVDLFRGDGRPAPDLSTYLLYVFYFPKLLAGPIIRYCDIEAQLRNRSVNLEDFRAGMVRFLAGLGKKVLIADHVGNFADKVFALDPAQLGCADAWLGVASFTLQIYFDFSGYSDMAIGISRALGFNLHENFNHPYLATSFTDFWRRWHISLSSWIKNYVYIPLGGSRCSTARSYTNLCICFILSGLWHGAAWTFLAWGTYHGVVLMLDRAFWLRWQTRLPVAVNRALTLGLVMLSWVVFRAGDAESMGTMFRVLFSPGRSALPNMLWLSPDIVASMLVGVFLIYLPLVRRPTTVIPPSWWRTSEVAASIALLLLVIGRLAVSSFNVFLYFRF